MRNVLSIFKRRNSEINVPVPALDVIESWSQNFSEMLKHECMYIWSLLKPVLPLTSCRFYVSTSLCMSNSMCHTLHPAPMLYSNG